jgi:hypothetical protein
MRRFLVTSPKYTGEAELVFDTNGRLVRVDVANTDMNTIMVGTFKAWVPADIILVEEKFAGSQATIVEADFLVTFEMFWNKYDKKINRKRCEPLWAKLSKVDQVKAFYGIDAYLKHLTRRESWRTKADPEKYIRDRYWENEWKS